MAEIFWFGNFRKFEVSGIVIEKKKDDDGRTYDSQFGEFKIEVKAVSVSSALENAAVRLNFYYYVTGVKVVG